MSRWKADVLTKDQMTENELDIYQVDITFISADGLEETVPSNVNFLKEYDDDNDDDDDRLSPIFPHVLLRNVGDSHARYYRYQSSYKNRAIYKEVATPIEELRDLLVNMSEVMNKLNRIIRGLKL